MKNPEHLFKLRLMIKKIFGKTFFFLLGINQFSFAQNAEPNTRYEWSPASGLSATDIAQPIANSTVSTTYYLTITDIKSKSSCAVRTDTVTVEVEEGICLPVQTLLTGHDKFLVYENQPGTHLKLYNALGQLIYTTTNYTNDFDVTLLPGGMYFYKLKFLQNNEWMQGKFVKVR